jgi:hypothetical protein
MRRSGILGIVLVMGLTCCGGTAAHVAPAGYTVSATVEYYPDGTAKACHTINLSLPSDCGSTLPITQLGNARLPFLAVAATRGAYLTPTMKLSGRWTGSSLALTSQPTRAAAPTTQLRVWSASGPPHVAQLEAGMPTAAGLRDQQALMNDLADLRQRGIVVMENGFDQAGLYVLVAAGDPVSVNFLHSRYNVQEIDAWLHPEP